MPSKKESVLHNIHTPDSDLGSGEADKSRLKNSCLHEASIRVGGVRQYV